MKSVLPIFGVVLLLILSIAGCGFLSPNTIDDSEGIPEGMTRVTINLGGSKAPDVSVLTWGTLTITGGGMDTITQDVSGGSVTLEVPAGPLREFTLTADTGTVLYRGYALENLTAGSTVNVELPMQLSVVDLLVIDTFNQRIVQLDNMTGAGRVNSADLSETGTYGYNPVAVDIDSNGFVYTAMPYIQGQESIIMRAPALDARLADEWEIFFDARNTSTPYYDFLQLKIRRTDNVLFMINQYSSTSVIPFVPNGLGSADPAADSAFMYGTEPLSTLYDIDVLDGGQIAVLGNTGDPNYFTALIVYDYDSYLDEWTELTSIGSNVDETFGASTSVFSSTTRMTHKGNTIYMCNSNGQGPSLDFVPIVFDATVPSLTFVQSNVTSYSTVYYQIQSIIPTVDDSFTFRVFDPENISLLVQFASASDTNPTTYDGIDEPFDFNEQGL